MSETPIPSSAPADLRSSRAPSESRAIPVARPEAERLTPLIEASIQELLAGLAAGKSEVLERYLAFCARFHQYSFHNQLLIQRQCPQATHVAGYRAWERLGYHVARGQRGIRIWAPRPTTRSNDETGEEDEPAVTFVTVAVFDASQLNPAELTARPLPTFFRPLEGDHQLVVARLIQVIEAEGVAVYEDATPMPAQGYSAHKRIGYQPGKDSTNTFLTLTHEFAHELLHWDAEGRELSRPTQECEAEAVSFIVARHFGVPHPYAPDYLQQWGTDATHLMAQLQRVRSAAAHIISHLEAAGEPSHHTTRRHPPRRMSGSA